MEFILGTAQFSGNYGIANSNIVTNDIATKVLNKAIELGINTLDTSGAYGNAHKIIGQNKHKFKIHTKIKELTNLEMQFNSIQTDLKSQIIDVVYLHDSKMAHASVSELIPLLKFRGSRYTHLGISVYTLEEYRKALKLGVFQFIQIPVNILDRKFNQNERKLASKKDVKLIARSVLLQGLLAAIKFDLPISLSSLKNPLSDLSSIASGGSLTLRELALKWALSLEDVDGLVLGVDNPDQLVELFNIFNSGKLSPIILKNIEKVEISDSNILDPRNWTF
jgi:aryl-alcohol dehydrogenase-like predicted oxidoreductase